MGSGLKGMALFLRVWGGGECAQIGGEFIKARLLGLLDRIIFLGT